MNAGPVRFYIYLFHMSFHTFLFTFTAIHMLMWLKSPQIHMDVVEESDRERRSRSYVQGDDIHGGGLCFCRSKMIVDGIV